MESLKFLVLKEMSYNRLLLMLLALFASMYTVNAQEASWFYIVAKDSLTSLEFTKQKNQLRYTGTDARLSGIFDEFTISTFKKTARNTNSLNRDRTFFVIAEPQGLLDSLLMRASYLFENGKVIPIEDRKIFEPNDYGLTSTIAQNKGLPVLLDYLDFLGLPQAWYYTTGSRKTVIGISDATIDTTNAEFKGKIKVFRSSMPVNGHGTGVSSIAAGQGDNAYGVPGVCYDCSIYATNYGDFRNFAELEELSKAGARVINCSWAGSYYSENGEQTIKRMFENGTIVVAGAGNRDYSKTKGVKLYYPASYEHVISVSSVMYKHETPIENIKYEKNGNPYAENIRGYIGRTLGFQNKKEFQDPIIYDLGVATLNAEVDLLAPTMGVFRLPKYAYEDTIEYVGSEATSTATPFVSGTIGLMLSLNPCLPVEEIEPILKLTSTNIDHIEANKRFKGLYGAGILNTGKAIKLLHDLYTDDAIAVISDQHLSRWKFQVRAFSEAVHIKEQSFTQSANFMLTAKNKIVVGANTVLRPDRDGNIHLKIDASLEKECDLELRED
ncbi:S8/S53 family peptidase [Altibacter sp.]|uniref:S8 family peptidase n=1 Tax=Altibacter sp. TaxID=2024823 RepID=UPI002582F662|nr:S8/S53 family peptidase [Altibacter sp.]MCW9037497.1 S8/S53 family peptidase [Altibacter sp.]